MNNSLNLVLYNPEIPQNTGNIIRLCHNTGSTLHLIKPLGFNFQDNKLRRAHMDYNEGNKPIIHDSFEHFVESEKPKKLYAVDTFGESSGLPKGVFFDKSITERIKIPMMEDSRSINLSNSVSIVLYESLRQINFKNF